MSLRIPELGVEKIVRRWTAADRPPPPFVRLRNRELLFFGRSTPTHIFNLSFLAVNGEYGAEKSWGGNSLYPTFILRRGRSKVKMTIYQGGGRRNSNCESRESKNNFDFASIPINWRIGQTILSIRSLISLLSPDLASVCAAAAAAESRPQSAAVAPSEVDACCCRCCCCCSRGRSSVVAAAGLFLHVSRLGRRCGRRAASGRAAASSML